MLDRAPFRFARIGLAAAAISLAAPAVGAQQMHMAIAGDWLTDTKPLVPAAGPCPITTIADYKPRPAAHTKSAAIIGKPSALEAMRAKQGGASLIGPLASVTPKAITVRPLAPAAPRFNLSSSDCDTSPRFATNTRRTSMLAEYRPGLGSSRTPSEYLGSRRVPIKHTFFDGEWSRVSKERASLGRVAGRLEKLAPTRAAKLRAVNLWVNRRIEYTEDRALFGRSDYWAGPRTTLALGKGDCEDYALLKMHMLAAMGIPREDMVLTIARDLVKRQDHAVLIVRDGKGGYAMLDNASDRVLDGSLSHDYRPVLSFSADKAWIHGY